MTATVKRPLEITWLIPIRAHGCGVVRIVKTVYLAESLYADDGRIPERLRTVAGYRLTSLDTLQHHDVDCEYLTCDCPDYLYRRQKRREACKHIEAVRSIP